MPALTENLLRNNQVQDEIARYKWIESEKRGCDIGFEIAAKEWVALYSKEWMKEHSVSVKKPVKRAKR